MMRRELPAAKATLQPLQLSHKGMGVREDCSFLAPIQGALAMKRIPMQYLVALFASVVLLAMSAGVFVQAASDNDKHFVEAALKGGMSEVELGKLAVQKGASNDVRQFGQKMVDDHTQLGVKMKAVAGQIGVNPPSMTSASGMALKGKLDVLSGDSFDKAYINAMVKDHEDDLADFKTEIASGSSPAVKTAARQG